MRRGAAPCHVMDAILPHVPPSPHSRRPRSFVCKALGFHKCHQTCARASRQLLLSSLTLVCRLPGLNRKPLPRRRQCESICVLSRTTAARGRRHRQSRARCASAPQQSVRPIPSTPADARPCARPRWRRPGPTKARSPAQPCHRVVSAHSAKHGRSRAGACASQAHHCVPRATRIVAIARCFRAAQLGVPARERERARAKLDGQHRLDLGRQLARVKAAIHFCDRDLFLRQRMRSCLSVSCPRGARACACPCRAAT